MMNNIKNNRLIWIVLLMWLCFLAPAHADSKKEGIDVQDIVFFAYPRRLHLAYY